MAAAWGVSRRFTHLVPCCPSLPSTPCMNGHQCSSRPKLPRAVLLFFLPIPPAVLLSGSDPDNGARCSRRRKKEAEAQGAEQGPAALQRGHLSLGAGKSQAAATRCSSPISAPLGKEPCRCLGGGLQGHVPRWSLGCRRACRQPAPST